MIRCNRVSGSGQTGMCPESKQGEKEMKSIKLVLLLLLVAALAAVVLQNQGPWQVHFLWLTGEMPGIILLFLTAAAGFIAGISAVFLMKRGVKTKK